MTSLIPNTKPYHRMEHYRDFIDATAGKIGLEKPTLRINSRFCDESTSHPVLKQGSYTFKNVVQLNLTFLIKAKDIPKRFHIDKLKNINAYREAFMRDIISWVNGYFQSQQLSYPVSDTEKEALLLLLYRAKDPALLEKAREFEIVHEMGHLSLNHIRIQDEYHYKRLFSLCALSAFGAASFVLSYYVNPFLVGAATIPLMGYKMYRSEYDEGELSRRHEYEADAFSVTTLKDKSGGVYYWTTKISFISVCLPDKDKEDLNPLGTHPPRRLRLKEIEKLTA